MRSPTPLLCLLGLTAISPCRAQRAQFGVKAGLLSSAATDIRSAQTASRWGGGAGGFWRYSLNRRVSLQAELLYEQRGVKTTQIEPLGWEGSFGAYTRQQSTRLQYGSLPLLLRGQVGSFFALAGPHLSGLMAARQQASTQYVLHPHIPRIALPYPTEEMDRSTDDFRRWELGYTAGVGYELGAHLALEVRYAAGLTKFYKPYSLDFARYEPISPLTSARNRAWQAQLSYQLSALKSN